MLEETYIGPSSGYKGPVTGLDPGLWHGHAELFCPRCGSTALDCIGFSRAVKWQATLECQECGAVFKRASRDVKTDKRFAIMHYGDQVRKDVFRGEVYDRAWETIVDRQFFGGDLQELAREYYGEAYETLESEYGPRCAKRSLDLDVPLVELACAVREGYIDGMDVGDEVRLPGTPISIVRTKNSKVKKGKRWLR